MPEKIYIYKVWDDDDREYKEWYADTDDLYDYARERADSPDKIKDWDDMIKVYNKLNLKVEQVYEKMV